MVCNQETRNSNSTKLTLFQNHGSLSCHYHDSLQDGCHQDKTDTEFRQLTNIKQNISKQDYVGYYTAVNNVKPIFHQKANGLSLGARVGDDLQREHFALPILTCWY